MTELFKKKKNRFLSLRVQICRERYGFNGSFCRLEILLKMELFFFIVLTSAKLLAKLIDEWNWTFVFHFSFDLYKEYCVFTKCKEISRIETYVVVTTLVHQP